ncbi:ester cyclase [Microvirga sp. M2]|uniref:ester cyclase n=1 Tax=Microvirga sp. M2 TaxID=3073270 RepID=UPI0039C1FFBE
MTSSDLRSIYRAYLDCLNTQDWPRLGEFVHEEVSHNDRPFGVSGYRAMLENDFLQIPDLRFEAERLVCEPPFIAARLRFDCSPKGSFLGLAVNGRRVSFTENVFYEFRAGRIKGVWSVIDKAAIEAQMSQVGSTRGHRTFPEGKEPTGLIERERS